MEMYLFSYFLPLFFKTNLIYCIHYTLIMLEMDTFASFYCIFVGNNLPPFPVAPKKLNPILN